MKFLSTLLGGALALGLITSASAQTLPIPTVSSINDADLFQDIVQGIPTAPSFYTTAKTLAGYTYGKTNGVNAQTGTTYTVLNADAGKLITFSNAAAIAVTLPQAGTANFAPGNAGSIFSVLNLGAGTVTITPTTSTINGNATLILPTGQAAVIYSDGTNYQVQVGGGGYGIVPVYVASAVDFLKATPSATGAPGNVAIAPVGTDTNVNLLVGAKGTGTVNVGGTTAANSSLQVATTTSAVNQVVVTGAATGSVPTITLGGSGADTNRNLGIAGAGTGLVIIGQAICTASGSTPQTCNGQRGIVTTNSLSTAAATDASYVINNSSVTSSSLVQCTDQGYSGTLVTNGYPVIQTCVPGSGTITVHITNQHAANALSGTVQIGFAVLN
jgi:hypothetical protein